MKVSELNSRTRQLPITVAGQDGEPDEVVHVTYRPGALTLGVSDKIREVAESGFEADVAKVMLLPLIVEWDLEEEDGSQLPFNEETLKSVPIEFLGMVLSAIAEDARPNLSRAGTSNDSSAQMGTSDPAPIGTHSSEQQIVSDAPPGPS